MRKNQKYTQEEMYLAIEIWQESGLSMQKFCTQEQLACGTFKYWLLKYRKEQVQSKVSSKKPFIPIKLSTNPSNEMNIPSANLDTISIIYPNGVEVTCPVEISTDKLQVLIKL